MSKTLDLSLVFILLLVGSSFAQLPTPTFTFGTGNYINSVVEIPQDTVADVTYCESLNGTTPTATTTGVCDPGLFTSTSGFLAISGPGTVTLKMMVTKAGSANSPVNSATYTFTTQAATNPVSVSTPTKLTNSSGSTIASMPFLAKDSSGNYIVFYTECTSCGISVDNGGTGRAMFKTSTDGIHWAIPANVACAFSGDPSAGCFYDESTGTTANIVSGGGLDYDGTLIILMAQWGGSGTNTPEGVVEMRCPRNCTNAVNWTAPSFVTTPHYAVTARPHAVTTIHSAVNDFINPTANVVTIAPGTPDVTGSCAFGCSFVSVYGENAYSGSQGLIFTYDHGVTWSDPLSVPQSWPYSVEERAILHPNGMNLLMLTRPTQDTAQWNEGSSPNSLMVYTSTNLGESWNSYSYDGGTQYGTPSNLPLSPCSVSPGTSWRDTWTRPSVVIDPNNSALAALLYGERLACNGVLTFDWKTVTFNITSAFSANAQNLPLPQTLMLDPITTPQPHTTYSSLMALNSPELLMVFEEGDTPTTEDIYCAVLGRNTGVSIANGIKLANGISIHGTAAVSVNKRQPVITWATPAAITYGTTLSVAQLNATASVDGTFVYSPAAETVPAIGLDALTVTFMPTDTVNYTTANATVVLTVGDFFNIEVSGSSSQTVGSGTAALYSLMVTPEQITTMPGDVTFYAAGLPPSATATFSPSTILAGSAATKVTLSLQTNAPQGADTTTMRGRASLGLMLLPLVGLLSIRKRRRQMTHVLALTLLIGMGGAILGLAGCEAGISIGPQPTNYHVVATATCGKLQHSANLTLNVQK